MTGSPGIFNPQTCAHGVSNDASIAAEVPPPAPLPGEESAHGVRCLGRGSVSSSLGLGTVCSVTSLLGWV